MCMKTPITDHDTGDENDYLNPRSDSTLLVVGRIPIGRLMMISASPLPRSNYHRMFEIGDAYKNVPMFTELTTTLTIDKIRLWPANWDSFFKPKPIIDRDPGDEQC